MIIIKKRIELIDFWRGIAIILMVLYHLLYDLKFIFNKDLQFFTIDGWYPIQQWICWSFIFLSGFSVVLSKNSFKNGVKIFVAAIILSIVTTLFSPSLSIKFGVLHLIGSSMIIVSFIKRENYKYPLMFGIISFIIFFLIWYFGLERLSFFESFSSYNLFPLGFYSDGFSSSDYFPILPWFFLFLTGFFIGIYHQLQNGFFNKFEFNGGIISLIGRHSLKIYLLHQVVIMGVLYLLRFIDVI